MSYEGTVDINFRSHADTPCLRKMDSASQHLQHIEPLSSTQGVSGRNTTTMLRSKVKHQLNLITILLLFIITHISTKLHQFSERAVFQFLRRHMHGIQVAT